MLVVTLKFLFKLHVLITLEFLFVCDSHFVRSSVICYHIVGQLADQ